MCNKGVRTWSGGAFSGSTASTDSSFKHGCLSSSCCTSVCDSVCCRARLVSCEEARPPPRPPRMRLPDSSRCWRDGSCKSSSCNLQGACAHRFVSWLAGTWPFKQSNTLIVRHYWGILHILYCLQHNLGVTAVAGFSWLAGCQLTGLCHHDVMCTAQNHTMPRFQDHPIDCGP